MGLKKIAARMIFGKLSAELSEFGLDIERKLVTALGATPMAKYEQLLDLKNLQGESTGYVRAYEAPRMAKLACMVMHAATGFGVPPQTKA